MEKTKLPGTDTEINIFTAGEMLKSRVGRDKLRLFFSSVLAAPVVLAGVIAGKNKSRQLYQSVQASVVKTLAHENINGQVYNGEAVDVISNYVATEITGFLRAKEEHRKTMNNLLAQATRGSYVEFMFDNNDAQKAFLEKAPHDAIKKFVAGVDRVFQKDFEAAPETGAKLLQNILQNIAKDVGQKDSFENFALPETTKNIAAISVASAMDSIDYANEHAINDAHGDAYRALTRQANDKVPSFYKNPILERLVDFKFQEAKTKLSDFSEGFAKAWVKEYDDR